MLRYLLNEKNEFIPSRLQRDEVPERNPGF